MLWNFSKSAMPEVLFHVSMHTICCKSLKEKHLILSSSTRCISCIHDDIYVVQHLINVFVFKKQINNSPIQGHWYFSKIRHMVIIEKIKSAY